MKIQLKKITINDIQNINIFMKQTSLEYLFKTITKVVIEKFRLKLLYRIIKFDGNKDVI